MSKTTRDEAMLAMGQIHGILIGISLTSRHDDEQREKLAEQALSAIETVNLYLKNSLASATGYVKVYGLEPEGAGTDDFVIAPGVEITE